MKAFVMVGSIDEPSLTIPILDRQRHVPRHFFCGRSNLLDTKRTSIRFLNRFSPKLSPSSSTARTKIL
ncbi:hypothetical protein BDZ97DRAFT_64772 [Flammula alnicola]|nr:hypothetical protein BDZ97DRAFT_64772 [Flammula alnicola]